VTFLPATLTAHPMADQQFADFCVEYPDLFFEMTAECEIIVMPPRFSMAGIRNSNITMQLGNRAENDGHGVACGSSIGFLLPNGARRSPDASWTPKEQIRRLPKESLDGYWHLCPAFVIELRSQSDRLRILREKMDENIANGAWLG
jgi:Uma2 family endonuclease